MIKLASSRKTNKQNENIHPALLPSPACPSSGVDSEDCSRFFHILIRYASFCFTCAFQLDCAHFPLRRQLIAYGRVCAARKEDSGHEIRGHHQILDVASPLAGDSQSPGKVYRVLRDAHRSLRETSVLATPPSQSGLCHSGQAAGLTPARHPSRNSPAWWRCGLTQPVDRGILPILP